MVNYQNISARAMLVSLRITTWTARRYDRKTSDEVTESKGADRKSARVNLHLLAGSVEHTNAYKMSTLARLEHYTQTLPWADEGWRLLPTMNYLAYTDAMRKRRAGFDAAVATFMDEYPLLREKAREKLGDLYDEADFPKPNELRNKFTWSIDFSPVPSEGDIRVSLPADQIAAIEAGVTDRVERAVKEAMADGWRRLSEAVARIKKAAATGGVVRSTLIDHAREVCDVLARLNVAEDYDLDAFRRRVESELTTIVVEDLRNDDTLRADTAKRADAIMQAMGAFYSPGQTELEVA